jgi:predicted nucleic acid-binding Zn ribbon protein
VTEVIHSMLEDGPTVCERCGGELRRVLYPSGIIFKGSGFYRTDSRSGGSDATDGTPAKTAAGAKEPSGAGKTDGGSTGSSSTTPGSSKPAESTQAD